MQRQRSPGACIDSFRKQPLNGLGVPWLSAVRSKAENIGRRTESEHHSLARIPTYDANTKMLRKLDHAAASESIFLIMSNIYVNNPQK